jgi:hypothetical protein
MKIACALLAHDVRLVDPRRIDLLGVFDRIERPATSFPARIETLYLVVRYEVHRAELGRPQRVEIVVSDEDGHRLFATGRRLTIIDRTWDAGPPAMPEYAMQAYGIHGLVLAAPGAYAFDVLVNGAHAVTVPLFARAIVPASAPPTMAHTPW